MTISAWPVPRSALFRATVPVPGSKSETNRALVLAALSSGSSTIKGGLVSRDTTLMRQALSQLGVAIENLPDGRWRVTPPARFTAADEPVDCGLAGTVLRFVPPIAALAPGSTSFVGDAHLSQRPVAPILSGLRQLGVEIADDADAAPFTMTAPERLSGSSVGLDSTSSSQFVSGFLLAGARYPSGLVIEHVGEGSVPSRPHVDMTVEMLRARGVRVDVADATWSVHPSVIEARDEAVAPDLTNAAVFVAAAAMARGEVSVDHWPAQTTQAGAAILTVLTDMGAQVERVLDRVTVLGGGALRGIDVDLHDSSELTPVVAALAVAAEGRTVIRGVAHIRGHETDRIAALVHNLREVGVEADELPDGLAVTGVGRDHDRLRPALWGCEGDHRLAHAGALVGLLFKGVVLDDVACTSKTMPGFADLWTTMLAGGA